MKLTLTSTPEGGWEWSDGTSTRGLFDSPEACIEDWRRLNPDADPPRRWPGGVLDITADEQADYEP
jgi:hypothetical protein